MRKLTENISRAKEANATEVTHLILEFNHTLTPQCNAKEILKDIKTKELAFLLYNLGHISENSSVLVEVDALSQIIKELSRDSWVSSKMIANALYGIGRIAKNKRSNGVFDAGIFQPLLVQLKDSTPDSQHIANSIYGLGQLAKTRQLHGELNALQPLLVQLERSKPNGQHIANSIYGLGQLAKTGQLHSELNALQPLLVQLERSKPNGQAIANSIYGLGELAKTGKLCGELRVNALQILLAQLERSTPKDQHIANSIYGLGQLAKTGQLHGELNVNALQPLLVQLECSSPNGQAIANSIYGLGELAKTGQLHGELNVNALQILLAQLERSTPSGQEIANSIYGLGELAKAGQLHGELNVNALQILLTQLERSTPSDQEIANSIYGLGQLAKAIVLPNLTPTSLTGILSLLDIENCNAIDLRQLLQGLIELRYQDPEPLNKLFDAELNTAYLHPNQAIILLEYYARVNSSQTGLNRDIFERLLDKLSLTFAMYSHKQQENLKCIITQLPPAEQERLTKQLGLLTPGVSSPLFMYTETDGWLDSADNEGNQSALNTPSDSIATQAAVITPIHRNRHAQALAVHQVHQSPEWEKASQNNLFRAIVKQDMNKLNRLLGIEHCSPKARTTPKARAQDSFFPEQRTPKAAQQVADVGFDKKQTANAMVTHFLQRTPALALNTLIAASTHEYFHHMLFACSKHTQYQFAIAHHLNPIILYLPLNELKRMTDELIRLGFYQDHRATLALVEALFLRKQLHSAETDLLTQLQYTLLDQAIEFHAPHHHVVTPKLMQQRTVIEAQNEQLFDEEDALETPLASSRTSEQSSNENEITQLEAIAPQVPAAVFREDPLMLDGEPNQHAYYTAEHVNQLLEIKLQNKENVHLIAPLDFHQASDEQNFKNHLLNVLGNNTINDNTHLIVPICINQHWVGVNLLVRKNTDGQNQINIAYYDSLTNANRMTRVINAVEQAVQQIFRPSNIEIKDKTHYLQDGTPSCGACLVENIVKDVTTPAKAIGKKQRSLLNTETLEFRKEHLELLGLLPPQQAVAQQRQIVQRRARDEHTYDSQPKRTATGSLECRALGKRKESSQEETGAQKRSLSLLSLTSSALEKRKSSSSQGTPQKRTLGR